jgi:long-chain acyl-CoA synthetase
MVASILEIEDLLFPGDRCILHLPLAHVFGRLVQFTATARGITIVHVPEARRIAQALEETHATILPTVPLVLERVRTQLELRFGEEGALRRALIRRALSAGARAGRCRRAGRTLSAALRLEYALADRLVLSKVRARFGGRLRLIVSGGAPLQVELAEFLESLGLLVLEGYGLTECAAVSNVNRPHAHRFGTVGLPTPGVEVRLAEDGEVLVRGPNVFQGYYRSEEETAEVLTDDGWLLTGDVGELDPDGFLRITGRKKELIVTAAGANIAPQPIEALLMASPHISQAVVVGDGRPHVAALIVIEEARAGLPRDEVERLVEDAVREVNDQLGPEERIYRFAILPRGLSQEQGELTPTLKPRRRVLAEHFREEIERLYGRG